MTLIALTTPNRRQVGEHAGRCRRFLLVHMEGARQIGQPTLVELGLDETLHATRDGLPPALRGVEVLITAGAGPGLARRLAAQGVQVLTTVLTDPAQALQAWAQGGLRPPALDEAPAGPASMGDAGCGCHGGCGAHGAGAGHPGESLRGAL